MSVYRFALIALFSLACAEEDDPKTVDEGTSGEVDTDDFAVQPDFYPSEFVIIAHFGYDPELHAAVPTSYLRAAQDVDVQIIAADDTWNGLPESVDGACSVRLSREGYIEAIADPADAVFGFSLEPTVVEDGCEGRLAEDAWGDLGERLGAMDWSFFVDTGGSEMIQQAQWGGMSPRMVDALVGARFEGTLADVPQVGGSTRSILALGQKVDDDFEALFEASGVDALWPASEAIVDGQLARGRYQLAVYLPFTAFAVAL